MAKRIMGRIDVKKHRKSPDEAENDSEQKQNTQSNRSLESKRAGLLQLALMKLTLVVCVALALCHSVVGKPPSHHAKHARKSPQPEMAGPKSFTLKTADGSVKNYSFEIPATLPPSKPGGGPEIKVSNQSAALAALAWAPGFYGSTHTTADSVDFQSTPQSYYLVHLTGDVGGARQPFYAAVLSNGQIVRPTATAGMAPAKATHTKKKAAKKKM
jgi:hypothetical protein